MSRRVLLDVDGVLCNFVGGVRRTVFDESGLYIPPNRITQMDLKKVLTPEEFGIYDWYCHKPGWCSQLRPYAGSEAAVSYLRCKGVEVLAVTAHGWSKSSTWCEERLEWLKKHFQFDTSEVIFATQKHLIHGDVLIEDSPGNLAKWHLPKLPILINRPWNQDSYELVYRVDSLIEGCTMASIYLGEYK